MLQKILILFLFLLVSVAMVTLLFAKLKELRVIRSSYINFFFRERYIIEKRAIDKVELGKNLTIFLLAGLAVVLLPQISARSNWVFEHGVFIIFVIITSAILFALKSRGTRTAEVLSYWFQKYLLPVDREYGEAGEIAPQFREPKKMSSFRRLVGWADFFLMSIFTLACILGFGWIILTWALDK